MRLLLFMFVTHNWGYSLNDFISIIIGKLNSSVIRRTHSSVSAPTSLITICVFLVFYVSFDNRKRCAANGRYKIGVCPERR